MENKPLKRNKNIVQLSKDHHFTLLFCWKIRQGLKMNIQPARIRGYVDYFWEHHMLPHFREEECILFISVNDERVEQAIRDHREIKKAISGLSYKEGNELMVALTALADKVDAHVRFEERELFPLLETVLTGEQLDEIGKNLASEKSPPDDFADQFWLLSKA
jgi:hemerythrin-like domain-containing protein